MEEMEVIDGNEVCVRTYVHQYSTGLTELISQYLDGYVPPY
jgi:hypothetical protein